MSMIDEWGIPLSVAGMLLATLFLAAVVKRYQELLDIRNSLRYWGNSFPALELMLEERRQAFQQKLPLLQKSTSFDRLEAFSLQRDEFAARLAEIEAREDYGALASPDQQDNLERLERVAASIDKVGVTR